MKNLNVMKLKPGEGSRTSPAQKMEGAYAAAPRACIGQTSWDETTLKYIRC